MPIFFEGPPPFDLAAAQSAMATFVGETVELTLNVPAPKQGPHLVPVRVRMTAAIARDLAGQLLEAAIHAELHVWKKDRL